MILKNDLKHYKNALNNGIFKDHTIINDKIEPIIQEIEEYDTATNEIIKKPIKINKYKLTFANFLYDNTSSILFKNKSKGYEYFEVGYNRITELLDTFENLYEVITLQMKRKYYMDLDFKDGTKVSLNDMNEFCRAFILYINTFYKVGGNPPEPPTNNKGGLKGGNAPFEITYCILASLNENEHYKEDEQAYKSIHIIFNIYTDTNDELKEVFCDFKMTNVKYANYIDLNCYSNMRLLRAYNQRKEAHNRTDKLKIIGGDTTFIINPLNSLITHITSNDILFKIPIRPKEKRTNGEIILTNYNINYNINQIDKLENYILKLTANDLTKKKWFDNLFIIIHILRLYKIEWNDILTHELTQLFLKQSVIPSYDTLHIKNSNSEIIKTICSKKELKRNPKSKTFFNDLDENEADFIYKHLKKQPHEIITITDEIINNKLYLLIQEGDLNDECFNTTQPLIYYDMKNYILLIDCKILNSTIKTNTKKIITAKEQYSLYIEKILNLPTYSFNNNKNIPFLDWNETDTNTNENAYYEAPVGSRKSSLRMFKDIGAILQENPTNCILMPCDTISLSRTHLTNMIALFKELSLDINDLKHYKDYDKDARQFNIENSGNIRLLICVYDSIWKFKNIPFTHIIIDEYVNVRKRFTQIKKDDIDEQNETIKSFFTLLQKAKVIKCYDADLPSRDLKLLEHYSKKKFNYYKLNDFTQTNNKVIFTNRKRMTDMILKDITDNKNITITTTTRKKAEELYTLLLQTKQELKICIIEGNGKARDHTLIKWSEKLKNDLISDTKLWTNYNVVIWTPTIMTGLSQESNKYFYRHYGFCGIETTDMTQTAQMLFRVRNTETNEIVICDTGDRATYFYDYMKTEKDIEKEIIKKKFVINNYINTKNIETNIDLISHNNYEIYTTILAIEEYHREQFYYDLFYTLRKWGCTDLKCEFYYFSNEEEFIFKQVKKVVYDDMNLIKINDFQDFITLEGIIDNKKVETEPTDEREIPPYKLKMLGVMKYGYSQLLFNTLNHTDLFNYIVFNIYNSKLEETIYNRLQKLTYYNVKECIYRLIELCFKDTTNIGNIYLKQKKQTDTDNFINWLFCSFIMFKIGGLLKVKITNETILTEGENPQQEADNYKGFLHSVITEQGGFYLLNGITSKFIKSLKPIEPLYNILVSNNKIIVEGKPNKIENALSEIIQYAFNYFMVCNSNVSITPTQILIDYQRNGIPYRLENEVCLLEKGDHDLNTNDYDDLINWLGGEKIPYYKSGYNREIWYKYLPKIRAYNHYNESKMNKRLQQYFLIYCNEANNKTLCELLYSINKAKSENVKKVVLENPFYIKEVEGGNPPDPLTNSEGVLPLYIEGVANEGEIFKKTEIEGYEVSNYGRVIYKGENQIPLIVEIKTLSTPICNDRKQESFNRITKAKADIKHININYVYLNEYVYFVERLVAKCFLDTYREDYFIKHINNCYDNDNSTNLLMVEKWEKAVYEDLLIADKEAQKAKNKSKRQEKANEKAVCRYCKKERTNIKRHEANCKENIPTE